MTIDEAIKELADLNENYPSNLWPEPNEAVRLGIEALKRAEDSKENGRNLDYELLPGETKD